MGRFLRSRPATDTTVLDTPAEVQPQPSASAAPEPPGKEATRAPDLDKVMLEAKLRIHALMPPSCACLTNCISATGSFRFS